MFNIKTFFVVFAIIVLLYLMYVFAKFIGKSEEKINKKSTESLSIMDEEAKPYYIQDDTKAFYAHGAKTESIKSVDTPDYVADTPVVKKKTAKKKTTKPKKTTSSKVTLPL